MRFVIAINYHLVKPSMMSYSRVLIKTALVGLLSLLISVPFVAQIPGYYNNLNLDLTGEDLLDELSTKISSNFTFIPYTSSSYDGTHCKTEIKIQKIRTKCFWFMAGKVAKTVPM